MVARKRKMQLVLVVWEDASTSSGWTALGEDTAYPVCWSVGWLASAGDGNIKLHATVGTWDTEPLGVVDHCQCMDIPEGWILYKRKFKKEEMAETFEKAVRAITRKFKTRRKES